MNYLALRSRSTKPSSHDRQSRLRTWRRNQNPKNVPTAVPAAAATVAAFASAAKAFEPDRAVDNAKSSGDAGCGIIESRDSLVSSNDTVRIGRSLGRIGKRLIGSSSGEISRSGLIGGGVARGISHCSC